MRRSLVSGVVAWTMIVAVATFVVLDFRAPDPVSAHAPAREFSAGRAWPHLVKVARVPHPPGTFEYAEVREYVAKTLADAGFEVQIQVTTVDERPTLSNVMGRLEGRCDTDDAVLLNTHYDSVPTGPGAGDAGTAVAALLETARALTAGKPLCNDVIILLNGAEESPLAGAEAFVARHPWVHDVRAVVNLDARGGTGPLIVGEWAQVSPDLLRQVHAVVPRFFANSLINEAQGQVKNHTTDMAVWKTLGVPGVNAVHIGDSIYYHRPGDTPAVVSRATLQHNGDTALAVARLFGNEHFGDLPARSGAVWVSLTSHVLVVYSTGFAWFLGAVVLALLVAVVWVARRQGARWSGLGRGTLAVVIAGLAGFVVVTVLLNLVRLLHPGADEYLHSVLPQYADLPDAGSYWWGFVAAAAATTVVVFNLTRRRLTAVDLVVSGVGVIAVLGMVTTVLARPVSYLFVLPAIASLVGALVWLTRDRSLPDRVGRTVVIALSAVPAVLVYVGMLRFMASARLGISAYFMPFVVFLLALLVPLLEPLRRVHHWLAPVVLTVVSVVMLGLGAATVDVDPSTTRIKNVDRLAPVASLSPVVFDRENRSPWTVGVVQSARGRTCLQASVRDRDTGDIGLCPILGALAPELDYQWGRTATGRFTYAPGARATDYEVTRPEATSAPILFGVVHGDAATIRVVADGRAHEARPTAEPGFAGDVWVVALPAGTRAVDKIVIVDGSGRSHRAAPGFLLRS